MRLDTMTTESSAKLYFEPPARSVAQFPGSMYPTATRNPGPANAKSLRKKLAEDGTTRLRWTSDKLGKIGCERKPASVCRGPESELGMTNLVICYY